MNTIPQSPLAAFHFSSGVFDALLPFSFLFFLGIYLIYSAVLLYHWQAYSTNLKVTGLTLFLYFAATVPLVFAMSALSFSV